MRRNVLKFHYEEIVFILMILATTDLKDYHEGDLMNFAEAILRLDSLADKDFLKKLKPINIKINNYVINRLIDLQHELSSLYDSKLHKALSKESNTISKCLIISRQLLMRLNEEYTEPTKYAEKHMDVDWD
ncbi:hypothetical protein [Cellulophaga sp. BC115SP]|uniref:hypothetical protein n=1 Tax=Cellulophaga sp. BC115SP TaxID=2683263 RepID=UPI001411D7B5|nr:hypothetical protein [Cellulophaga sp. BC115SP]NBB26946.1 hypothetical protein [Cellulophaga sp. BC115SP]